MSGWTTVADEGADVTRLENESSLSVGSVLRGRRRKRRRGENSSTVRENTEDVQQGQGGASMAAATDAAGLPPARRRRKAAAPPQTEILSSGSDSDVCVVGVSTRESRAAAAVPIELSSSDEEQPGDEDEEGNELEWEALGEAREKNKGGGGGGGVKRERGAVQEATIGGDWEETVLPQDAVSGGGTAEGAEAAMGPSGPHARAKKDAAVAECSRPLAHNEIRHGGRVVERGSAFQGHACICTSLDGMRRAVQRLRASDEHGGARHQVAAFRCWERNLRGGGKWVHKSEDGGVKKGGARVLERLKRLGAKNLCVVVSCWGGGAVDIGESARGERVAEVRVEE
eukprot:COSAG01_NODE_1278_length_10930_cov_22.050226_3_plen_342_part_00